MACGQCGKYQSCFSGCCPLPPPKPACFSVSVGTTTTGEPGTAAQVTNSGDSCNAVLNFVIPQGEKGENGTNGTPGQAATISIGTVETTDSCENVSVTNSGTEQNAVLNFVIPCAKANETNIVTAVNPSEQTTASERKLNFEITSALKGTALSHAAGSGDIVINDTGIYQAVFRAVVTPAAGAALPATEILGIYLNNSAVTGASAVKYFTTDTEAENMSVTAFFNIETLPAVLSIYSSAENFAVTDAAFTVIKIG